MLDRELLDGTILTKYQPSSPVTGTDSNGKAYRYVEFRFPCDNSNSAFDGSSTNNYTKNNACLTADLFSDWREEVVMRVGSESEQKLRMYTSALPTDYRLYTLMHDSQYRCAIAWIILNRPTLHTT